VFAVWEPMLVTDWQRPGPPALSRLPDARVHQYWDQAHLLARSMAAAARDPQPTPKCCVRDGVLWDLAAVYPPGAKWDDRLPPAVFFDGPVVNVEGGLEAYLTRLPPAIAR